jgi:hypothetical protein
MLTRADIHAARDFTLQTVEVPEWGGAIYLRSITVGALDEIQIRYIHMSGGALLQQNGATDAVLTRNPEMLRDMKPRLLSYSICDAEGTLLFDDDAGRAILRSKDPAVIDRLYVIAEGLSGMTAASLEEEKKPSALTPMPDSN